MESVMKTLESPSATSPSVMAEMTDAIDHAVKGIRDPGTMSRTADRMDRMREEMRQRTGDVEIAVAILRESRDDG